MIGNIGYERRLQALERRAREIGYGVPEKAQSFTPSLYQGGAVSSTILVARYSLDQKTVHVVARLQATGAGTAFATIAVADLPAQPLYHDTPFGMLEVYDASAGRWYSGPARTQAGFGGGLYAWGIASGAANVMGSDTPAIALANGDIVSLYAHYEIA
jgi:hypothetical protein